VVLEGADDGYLVDGKIVGGESESGYLAVGAMTVGGDLSCTGTLVSSTVVITAAHCVMNGSATSHSFFVGTDSRDSSTGTSYPVASWHPHPDYNDAALTNDIAVLVLAEAVPNVDPIPLLTTAMDSSYVNQEALFIGFGLTSGNSNDYGEKRSVSIPITEIMETSFRYSGEGINTCNGDSGGPTLYEVAGEMTLIGVTSYGDRDCEEYGVNTRIDTYVDFINGYLDDDGSSDDDSSNDDSSNDDSSDDDSSDDGSSDDGSSDDGSSDDDSSSDDVDFCEEWGWYGDGICDEDCAEPDPDCDE
jgi:V8-like Glu-specific endopeptidase